ncbi:probable serine/threonine-protein kinase DDB_G0277165 [Anneissia japonica]|uniref:probable serine/threonine-protein kinase DDB_G0277165 n=1 Tax=Anneissia japonica TaxID=1529436 RepID=UPI0014255AF0|nr:probable serine/threonine-protein kinase DDB_G0277165 [Anneissia japonica]
MTAIHCVNCPLLDLKVENLLLDNNNNIKIIDFGLSNLISNLKPVVRENSGLRVYTGTQCGSPAYAAPEIIANRKYGPKVDVWSIGVNMFAMLSGTLPFVIEPFNLKLLLHRMLKGQMSEFPSNISIECKSFILKLLEPNQVKRLSIRQVVEHEWLNGDYLDPVTIPAPAGRMSRMDIDPDVIHYAHEKLGLDIDHMTTSVIRNKANHISAIYYLLLKKVENRNMCVITSRIPYSTKELQEMRASEETTDECDVTTQKLAEEANNLQSNHLKRNSLHFKMALLAGIHHNKANQPQNEFIEKSDAKPDTTTAAEHTNSQNGDLTKIEIEQNNKERHEDDDGRCLMNNIHREDNELRKQFDEVMTLKENISQTENERDITGCNENAALVDKGVTKVENQIREQNISNNIDKSQTTMDFAVFEQKKKKPNKNKHITRRETENKFKAQREIYQRMLNRKNILKAGHANLTSDGSRNTYPQLHRRKSLGYNRSNSFVLSKTCISKRRYKRLPDLGPRRHTEAQPGGLGNARQTADDDVFMKILAHQSVSNHAQNSPAFSIAALEQSEVQKKRSIPPCNRNTAPSSTTSRSNNSNNVVGKILIDRNKMKSQIKVVLTDKTRTPRRISSVGKLRKDYIDNTSTTITPLNKPKEDINSGIGQEVTVRPVPDLQPPLININKDRAVLRKLSAVL